MQTLVEEAVYENPKKLVAEAGIRRRLTFIQVALKRKHVSSSKNKNSHYKFGMRMVGERFERFDLPKSFACASAGIDLE